MKGRFFSQLRFDEAQVQKARRKAALVLLAIFLGILLCGWFTAPLRAAEAQAEAVAPEQQLDVYEQELEDPVCSFLPRNISGWNPRTLAKWETVRHWCTEIEQVSEAYSIDPKLFASLLLQESGGWAGAESTAGAIGLAQVMPFHDCSSWDPLTNMDCGAWILSGHLANYDLRQALAAYNAGENGMLAGNGFDFADAVLGIYAKVQESS